MGLKERAESVTRRVPDRLLSESQRLSRYFGRAIGELDPRNLPQRDSKEYNALVKKHGPHLKDFESEYRCYINLLLHLDDAISKIGPENVTLGKSRLSEQNAGYESGQEYLQPGYLSFHYIPTANVTLTVMRIERKNLIYFVDKLDVMKVMIVVHGIYI